MEKIVFVRNDATIVKFSDINEMIIEHDVIYVKGYEEIEESSFKSQNRVYVGRLSEIQRVYMERK